MIEPQIVTKTIKTVVDGQVVSLREVQVEDPSLVLSTYEVRVFRNKPTTVELSYFGEGTITVTNPNPIALSTTYDSVTRTIALVNNQSEEDSDVDVNLTVSLSRPGNCVIESVTLTAYLRKDMNDCSWSDIKDIIQAGHADYFKVGDTKDIILNLPAGSDNLVAGQYFSNAVSGTYKVVVLGIDHNSELEGTNRVHFCIGQDSTGKEIDFSGMNMNTSSTNSGGWNGCSMRTWLNNTLINGLPSDLVSVITPCTKYTDNTGNKSNSSSAVTATSDKLWLLSEFEVFGNRHYANQYEQNKQAQYDYYKNGASKVRYRHHSTSSALTWWLRSAYRDYSTSFCYVNKSGVYAGGDNATWGYGVVPCFTIS